MSSCRFAQKSLLFVVITAQSRKAEHRFSLNADLGIQAEPVDVERQLLPMLRANLTPNRSEILPWTEHLVQECRRMISHMLLPLQAQEIDFLTRLNERGEIAPECLTGDKEMQAIIQSHPALLWKAMNVGNYFGGRGSEGDLSHDSGNVKEG